MTAANATSIRREHESRDQGSVTPESLLRDAMGMLDRCGVSRSPKWVQRIVREYTATAARVGFPFGPYLLNRVQLNAEQRRAILAKSDLRYLLEYADPTGEQAVRNVMSRRG